MNARSTFPLLDLPLGGGEPSTPPHDQQTAAERENPASSSAAVGQQEPSPQYRRLFGNLSPAQVMMTPPVPSASGGRLGVPSPAAPNCDPADQLAAEHHFSQTIMDVARLRARHLAKGHTPEADAAHGPVFFKRHSDDAWRDAMRARSDETRRKRLITSIAILVAQVDCEDFLAQKGPPHE